MKLKFVESSHEKLIKNTCKLAQRIGLSFLKTKVAAWRYTRGKRYLCSNLAKSETINDETNEISDEEEVDEVNEKLEDVIEILLKCLRSESTEVRWSSAKGIGRITNRLPKEMAQEIVGSILELFNFGETDCSWHGGCLTLAELGRRGLILPENLPRVMIVTKKALFYDELKGTHYVGSHVRDAACYICWSFARAYSSATMEPFQRELAKDLLCVALFDREINCRRAAAAAFQENVGRQGAFPQGIEILANVDYLAVGQKRNSFIELAKFVGSYHEYNEPLLDHLVRTKVIHWDADIRELASESVYHLCVLANSNLDVISHVEQLVKFSTDADLNFRHGAVLALAQVIRFYTFRDENVPQILSDHIRMLTFSYVDKNYFRGTGEELTKHSFCSLLEQSCNAKLPFHEDKVLLSAWVDILLATCNNVSTKVRRYAIDCVRCFCLEYLVVHDDLMAQFIAQLLSSIKSPIESIRTGAFEALAVIPHELFVKTSNGNLLDILASYVTKRDSQAQFMTNARAAAINCAVQFAINSPVITKEEVRSVYKNCLFIGLDDYTMASNGDIGLDVRESAVGSLQVLD